MPSSKMNLTSPDMLRFFRTLRQRLLAENRVSRYLLYAVGEILLVVIGILLALQINAWNDVRLERKASLAFYANTRQQLLEDRRNIVEQIAYNNQFTEQFTIAIELIGRGDRKEADSLATIAVNLMDYSDFDRQGNIYETMVNSGDIRLIQNPEIKEELRSIEETYLYINRMESIHLEAIMKIMSEHLIQAVNFTSGKAIDADLLLREPFQNLFAIALNLIREKDAVYHRCLREIDGIVAHIENEIASIQTH